MLQHEQEEIADDHSDYDTVSVHLELVLLHLGELEFLVLSLFTFFFLLLGLVLSVLFTLIFLSLVLRHEIE